jgi:transcriptional regulator with XRE-family HTH domain
MRLRDERVRRGWSQTRLSGLTGISQADISAIECGRQAPWPSWRRRIAEVMGIPEAELFNGGVGVDQERETSHA